MKKKFSAALLAGVMSLSLCSGLVPQTEQSTIDTLTASAASGPSMEYLNRGITAVNTGSGMLVSWRYLANDPDDAIFKLYRDDTLVYTSNSGDATCYLDASGSTSSTYRVETYNGDTMIGNETCSLSSGGNYFDIKVDNPGSGYTPNDCSVGDVDGDGDYELFVKWDPSNSKDNSQKGKTGKVYIDCYTLEGTKLWRIDLGVNIRAGAHYTQFYVADFDLDGKAEMTCKTADGTIDGTGKAIGDASASYVNGDGLIITGPEYYTLFDGETGAALDTIDYPVGRGDVTKWGKSSDKFNRVDRFWGMVAYLDGVTPAVVTGRGYYGRMTATALKVENDKLVKLWTFDSGTSSSTPGYGDGNHNSMPADVDGDGKQEIITGATCIDDDGSLKWCINTGHGDAMHVGDLVPDNPGIEVYICHEDKPYGVTLIDGDTGSKIFHKDGSGDTGRCCADNVWTGNDGAEFWGNGNDVYNSSGSTLSCRRPAINFLSYWDGDLEREILDGYTDSPATISDMKADGTLTTLLSTDGYYTCNTTKGTPCLSADMFGDWREELVVRAADGKSVRIYTTTYDTDYRITTLMHDAQYRNQVAAQNTAYNQPPHTSFYLGSEEPLPARPNCTIVRGGKTGATIDTTHTYRLKNQNSGLYLEVAGAVAANGTNVQQGTTGAAEWTVAEGGDGYYYVYSTLGDGQTYLLDLDFGNPDNGTNIGIWGNTNSDAQLFKFVKNADGSYTICTKATADKSALGVTSASKDEGANVVQWECDGTSNQNWILEIVVPAINGNLIQNLQVLDTNTYRSWSIDTATASGEMIFGDRDVTYVQLPAELEGAESILTACDAKNATTDLAAFQTAKDATIYVGFDTRVAALPAWTNGWTKMEGMTVTNNKDVVFQFYAKDVAAGETVTLGQNGQSSGCVNYTVFAVEKAAAETTTTTEATTTTTEVTTTTETTTTTEAVTTTETTTTTKEITTEETTTTTETTTVAPDAFIYGDSDGDGEVGIGDVLTLNKNLLAGVPLTEAGILASDVNQDGKPDSADVLIILKYSVGIIDVLPV